MYAIYSVLIVAFFVVMSPYLLYQAIRYRKYVTSLPQRLGILPVSFNLDGDESIWIHAVSVGEVLTARAMGMRVAGVSCITNLACGIGSAKASSRSQSRSAARKVIADIQCDLLAEALLDRETVDGHEIDTILEGKPLPVYGKGLNVRDWLYVEDHARALWTVVQNGRLRELIAA